ncbi:MAG: DUF2027 domain-containing protein [Paludibacteraceae bacterium]|nr:DUF2027 domain-containing protein [Paludibacteraceae bacterium]
MAKVGDRVRFLNSVGGGIISKIINKELVTVTDEDGFDVPTLLRECVVIESAEEKLGVEQKKEEKSASLSGTVTEMVDDDDYVPQETPEGEQLTLYLAFVPQNIKSISSTDFDLYLVNDSNYYLAYNIAEERGAAFYSRFAGFIQPNTKILLDELSRECLNDFEKVKVQFFALKQERSYMQKPVFDLSLKINPVKFYKLHSFKENDYFEELAMLVALIEKDQLPSKGLTNEELQNMLKQKEVVSPAKVSVKHKHLETIEVDLHIGQLLDNLNGLSNSDMLQYQLAKFEEIMNQNLKKKGQKIVFIHGKGNGVLRNEILKRLKQKYSFCEAQDASFWEYGYGATMVKIR